mmetsp:Transcript_34168/g.59709  ORF Transcript_34168/g.59709 Transcript_34168/m.59709 type:complete len:246 (+) Transcript_34168:7318-8055(+)
MGSLHLSKNLYMQFPITHLNGHHKHVGTPMDGSTAKLGQSVFSFVYQSIIYTLQFAWSYEAERLGTLWSWKNRNLWFLACEGALFTAIYVVLGRHAFIFAVAQALVSIFLLECINYIEHYGLERKVVAPGQYEPVSLKHSWNAPQALQNYITLKLQRHSDHHFNSYKPYQTLCSYEISPTLPCGYGMCITAALCPPIWFSIIDPLVKQANDKGVVSLRDLEQSERTLKMFVGTQCTLVLVAFMFI